MSSTTLNAVSAALSVHPRTVLRLTTGLPNPYWAHGFDPVVDITMVAACVGNTEASIETLMKMEDAALTVDEAAQVLKCTPAEFYRKELPPDWQVGRVKRYSLIRMSAMG